MKIKTILQNGVSINNKSCSYYCITSDENLETLETILKEISEDCNIYYNNENLIFEKEHSYIKERAWDGKEWIDEDWDVKEVDAYLEKKLTEALIQI